MKPNNRHPWRRTQRKTWDRQVKVMLTCNKNYVPEDEVEFENIEEDFQGRDVLTFKCPECGKTHQSYRVA